MGGLGILSLVTFLPLAGAVLIFVFRAMAGEKSATSLSKPIALIATLVTFAVSLVALSQFDPKAPASPTGAATYQLNECLPWFVDNSAFDRADKNADGVVDRAEFGEGLSTAFGADAQAAWAAMDADQNGSISKADYTSFISCKTDKAGAAKGVSYRMGVDGMAILLIVLTTFLTPMCILQAFKSIEHRVPEYMMAFLALETLMLGVFCSLDLVLFYVFFEGGLIPMFIIIGVWGGKNRLYAAFKFFLYTLLGSLLLLAALVWMFNQAGTTSIPVLQNFAFAKDVQTWLWLAFFASFAVKLPMFPVHTWLPDAHVEAPTGGSVILAGVLLKMGGYGFIRFSLPMFPDASLLFQPLMFWMSVIAIIYASLVAFRQTDIKKLVAYSSVAHMGFVTLGIFSFTEQGIQGAIFQMISHGVISGALFFCVGVIYDRMHTREIAFYGGLVHRMPVYAALFMLFSMANVGLPGTSGFVGEILTMVGGFQASTWAAAGAALGVILSAVYMLTLYRRTVFGELTNQKLFDIKDVTASEFLILALLAISALVLGVAPSLVFDITKGSAHDALVFMGRPGVAP